LIAAKLPEKPIMQSHRFLFLIMRPRDYLCGNQYFINMNKFVCLLIAAFALTVSVNAQEKKAAWKEMNDFHTVMSETFHPAEEGHLDPIKKRSQEMVDKAVAWQGSTAPAGYDKKQVDASLKKLVKGAKELHKMVKAKAADNALKEKLSGLHEVFHEIMEKCEKEDHHQ
jgi:hypothetical protein